MNDMNEEETHDLGWRGKASSRDTPVNRVLHLLENDLDALGWDQPTSVYSITNTLDDPVFELLAQTHGHPVDMLQAAYTVGLRMPPDSIGIALATEGWRNLVWEEAIERHPEILEIIHQVPDALDLDEAKIIEIAKKAWNRVMANARPSEQAPENRVELRNISVIFKTGETMLIMRERGEEPQFMEVGEAELHEYAGRVPEAMERFLKGLSPEEIEETTVDIHLDDEGPWKTFKLSDTPEED